MYKEPKHRLAFENSQAMILDVNLPPGYVSLYHKHQLDTLYVTISGTQVWAQPLAAKNAMPMLKPATLGSVLIIMACRTYTGLGMLEPRLFV